MHLIYKSIQFYGLDFLVKKFTSVTDEKGDISSFFNWLKERFYKSLFFCI